LLVVVYLKINIENFIKLCLNNNAQYADRMGSALSLQFVF